MSLHRLRFYICTLTAGKVSVERFAFHSRINCPCSKSGKDPQSSVVCLTKTPTPVLVWGCCDEPLLLLKCSVVLLRRQRPLSKLQVLILTVAAAAQQISGIRPASVGSRQLRQERAGTLVFVGWCRGGSSGWAVQDTCGVSVTLSVTAFFLYTVVSNSIVKQQRWSFTSFC